MCMSAPSEGDEDESRHSPGKKAWKTSQAEGVDAGAFPIPREGEILCWFKAQLIEAEMLDTAIKGTAACVSEGRSWA